MSIEINVQGETFEIGGDEAGHGLNQAIETVANQRFSSVVAITREAELAISSERASHRNTRVAFDTVQRELQAVGERHARALQELEEKHTAALRSTTARIQELNDVVARACAWRDQARVQIQKDGIELKESQAREIATRETAAKAVGERDAELVAARAEIADLSTKHKHLESRFAHASSELTSTRSEIAAFKKERTLGSDALAAALVDRETFRARAARLETVLSGVERSEHLLRANLAEATSRGRESVAEGHALRKRVSELEGMVKASSAENGATRAHLEAARAEITAARGAVDTGAERIRQLELARSTAENRLEAAQVARDRLKAEVESEKKMRRALDVQLQRLQYRTENAIRTSEEAIRRAHHEEMRANAAVAAADAHIRATLRAELAAGTIRENTV